MRTALLLILESAQGPWLCPSSAHSSSRPASQSRLLGSIGTVARRVDACLRPGVTEGAQSQEFLEFLAPGFAASFVTSSHLISLK